RRFPHCADADPAGVVAAVAALGRRTRDQAVRRRNRTQSAFAQRDRARRRAHTASAARRLAARIRRRSAMTRVSLLLLCVLIGCALSLVTSRYQARSLTAELEREQV